jgi:hypothetical protein
MKEYIRPFKNSNNESVMYHPNDFRIVVSKSIFISDKSVNDSYPITKYARYNIASKVKSNFLGVIHDVSLYKANEL